MLVLDSSRYTASKLCYAGESVNALFSSPIRVPFEIHYTPNHGNWLNIAEIKLSSLGRQCLSNNRIPDLNALKALIAPWCVDRNKKQKHVKRKDNRSMDLF